MAFVLKHARARDFMIFIKPFIEMLNRLEHESESTPYQITLINYLLAVGETGTAENFVDALKEGVSAHTGENIMSIASQLMEKGFQKGIEQEREAHQSMASRLIEEAMQRGESTILIHLLECKFGKIPTKYREQINQADTKQLLAWTGQALKTNVLSELFALRAETST